MNKRLNGVKVNYNNNAELRHLVEWFVHKENMSHKKIQKLCYYAQVWSFVLNKTDIIPGIEFQAWVHGPVNPEIWDMCKKFGWRDIMIAEEFKVESKTEINEMFNDSQKEILELVWDTYGEHSADELEEMTHLEDPWKNARRGLGEYEKSDRVISNESLEEFYMDMYE